MRALQDLSCSEQFPSFMLRILRHQLILLLFVLLPCHALFVTLGTKLITGAGHAPLSSLAIWKEGLMALIFLVSIIELFFSERGTIRNVLSWKRGNIGKEQAIIVLLLLIALFLFPVRTDLAAFVYGFKYVFVPLIFFIVLASLPWEEGFLEKKIFPALLIIGGVVSF